MSTETLRKSNSVWVATHAVVPGLPLKSREREKRIATKSEGPNKKATSRSMACASSNSHAVITHRLHRRSFTKSLTDAVFPIFHQIFTLSSSERSATTDLCHSAPRARMTVLPEHAMWSLYDGTAQSNLRTQWHTY